MSDDGLDLARVWLAYIDADVLSARQLLDEVPSGAAFHVQQAVEKSFKAIIALQGLEPPRTHDLVRLHALVGGALTWERDDAWLAEVSSWVATTRYPTDVPNPLPQTAVVMEALEQAERIVREVKARLA